MSLTHRLSKSRFVTGLQCLRELWWTVHEPGAPELIPGPDEQAALADMVALRADGRSLMYIRDVMRGRGHRISHRLVANTIARQAQA